MARPQVVGAEGGGLPDLVSKPVVVDVATKRAPKYTVVVGNQDLHQIGIGQFVRSITVEETDDEAPMAVVDIWNKGGKFTDDFLFASGREMAIRTGYIEEDAALSSRGVFIVEKPKFQFGDGSQEIIQLRGYGAVILLSHEGQKRREFVNVTDSEIAKRLAQDHGLVPDVDETQTVYDKVLQVNETDIQLLRARARLHGFQVYVEDQVLHFHRPRYRDRGIVLVYRQANAAISRAAFTIDALHKGLKFELTEFDPRTKDRIDAQTPDEDDPISKRIAAGGDQTAKRTWRDVTKIEGQSPKAFVLDEGHVRTPAEARAQVEGFGQASRWVNRGRTESVGVGQVRATDIITLLGLGKFSGRYYVKRARHMITAEPTAGTGLYGMELEVYKTSTSELGEVRSKFFGVSHVAGAEVNLSEVRPVQTFTRDRVGAFVKVGE